MKMNRKVRVGDNVVVPDSKNDDIWNHSFQGTIIDILDNGNVIIEDNDNDCFEVNVKRLILSK